MENRTTRCHAVSQRKDTPAAMRHKVEVINYRSHTNGPTLRAWVDLAIPDLGLRINRASVHRRKDGREWLAMPAQQIRAGDSSIWVQAVEFTNGGSYAEFQRAALEAITAHESAMGVEE